MLRMLENIEALGINYPESVEGEYRELEIKIIDALCQLAAELKPDYLRRFVKELSKTATFIEKPFSISERAKAMLRNVVLSNLDKLHIESLLNLPLLINGFQLDIDGESGRNTGELMRAMLVEYEKTAQKFTKN